MLSHYDLGVIESVTEFKRGSRRSPKVGIVCQRGKFLLKKRDLRRGGLDRAQYAHAIQSHLEDKGFPLPCLIRPTTGDSTILELAGRMYEMYDYVAGHPYSGECEETQDAGRTLALFHRAMTDFRVEMEFEGTGYHDAVAVQTGLNAIPTQVSGHESAAGKDAEILGLTSFLFEAYVDATTLVDESGFADWPECIAHSDWHPGNLLFKRGKVLAVIDYDCARMGKAVCDVANGALQFSIIAGGSPEYWPDHLDLERVRSFIRGYEELSTLPEEQIRAVPQLMIEALIAESVLPIAATGSFGPFDGFGFMQMVRRKVAWIQHHVADLVGAS